jgi:hypothetical protein
LATLRDRRLHARERAIMVREGLAKARRRSMKVRE